MRQEIQLDIFGAAPTPAVVLAADEPTEKVSKRKKRTIDDSYLEGLEVSDLGIQKISFDEIYEFKDVNTEQLFKGGRNTAQVMKTLHMVKRMLVNLLGQETIDRFVASMCFAPNVVHVVPTSGGADSTGIGIILRALFPEVPFLYVFTDTKAESPGLYYQLDLMEQYLGITINRVTPEYGLYDLIAKYNGFMPSAKARYCTAELKIKPLMAWLEKHFDTSNGVKVINHVGIRYDEDRAGMMAEDAGISTNMPYMALRMGKMEVFSLLLKTIGIPSFYAWKTRSGCISCFFLRRSEKSAQLYHEPKEFAFVKWGEKLTNADVAKFGLHWNQNFREGLFDPRISIPFSKSLNLYPVIPSVDPRTRHNNALELQMMPNKQKARFFVGIAMYAPRHTYGMCNDHLVYKQEFAVYSPLKATLKKQLVTWYEHQSTNFVLKGFNTLDELEDDINLVSFEIEVDKRLGDALLSKPDARSFTNSDSESYAQIEAITRLANAVLVYERTKQDWDQYKKYYPQGDFDPMFVSSMASVAIRIKQELDKQTKAMSLLNWPSIVSSERVETPTQDEILERQLRSSKIDIENKEAIEVCAMCSI